MQRDPAVGDFKSSKPIVFSFCCARGIRRVLTRVVDPVVQLEDVVFLEIERRFRSTTKSAESTTNGDTIGMRQVRTGYKGMKGLLFSGLCFQRMVLGNVSVESRRADWREIRTVGQMSVGTMAVDYGDRMEGSASKYHQCRCCVLLTDRLLFPAQGEFCVSVAR